VIKKSDISILDFNNLLQDRAKKIGISPDLLQRDLHVDLSGGEKKLMEVLQMDILKPKFAFLDEIDSGVDVDSARKVFQTIKRLQKEEYVGFLLVTHYNTILDHISLDRVYVMREGAIIKSGGEDLASKIAQDGYENILSN